MALTIFRIFRLRIHELDRMIMLLQIIQKVHLIRLEIKPQSIPICNRDRVLALSRDFPQYNNLVGQPLQTFAGPLSED